MSGRGQTTDRKRKLLLVNFSIVKMASPSMRCRRSAWDSASTGGFRYNRLAPHCLCLSIHLDKVRVLFYMVAQIGHRPYPSHCHIVPCIYLLRQRRRTKRRLACCKMHVVTIYESGVHYALWNMTPDIYVWPIRHGFNCNPPTCGSLWKGVSRRDTYIGNIHPIS